MISNIMLGKPLNYANLLVSSAHNHKAEYQLIGMNYQCFDLSMHVYHYITTKSASEPSQLSLEISHLSL